MRFSNNYGGVVLSLFAAFFLLSGCATTLKFNKISNETRLPSLITLHFSLQTEDGEPVPYLKAEDFVIKEDGKEVSVFESKQTILPRNKQFELVTLLLLDMSGSIIESGSLTSLQEAMKVFIETVSESQIVSIYAFDGRKEIQQLLAFTSDKKRMLDAVGRLPNYKAKDPSTNLNGAVLSGLPIISKRVAAAKKIGKITTGTMILFTDGTDQAGRIADSVSRGRAMKSKSSIFAIGLGGEIDKDHLKSIGQSGFEFADDTDDIVEAFASIAEKIKRESNKYYAIAYCSPKRAGRHHLEISVRDYDGSMGYGFNATGFTPQCDPKKALERKRTPKTKKTIKAKKKGKEQPKPKKSEPDSAKPPETAPSIKPVGDATKEKGIPKSKAAEAPAPLQPTNKPKPEVDKEDPQ